MANKKKEIVLNNLLAIREELGYSQIEMGAILDVSDRMICNYETGENNLPLEKALLLSQKYNYSLDWIYCNTTDNQFLETTTNYPTSQTPKFLVDIRDFLFCQDKNIIISISNSYWEYINRIDEIEKSSRTQIEKTRERAELNGTYKQNDKTNIAWELSTSFEDFMSIIHFGNSSFLYYSDKSASSYEPTGEQIQKVKDFLNDLIFPTEDFD